MSPAATLARRPLRRLARLAAPAFLAAAAACGDATGPDDQSVVGVYTLVSFDGRPVPAVIDNAPGVGRTEVVRGEFDLQAGRRFTAQITSRFVDARANTTTDETTVTSGRYTVSGTTVTLANTTDGELDDERLTVRGSTLTYGPLTFRR